MKRLAAFAVILLMAAAALTGCGTVESPPRGIRIVCTIFPVYDWVRELLGEQAGTVELTLLPASRTDPHSYQPSVDDVVKIADCDLFIYVGGESDQWVQDVLNETQNAQRKAINLMDMLGEWVKQEPGTKNAESEYDEHIWLSLKNAQLFCTILADALSALDAPRADDYQDHLNSYIAKLHALDEQYQAAANAGKQTTLLFGDRFPFRYLADDYGLQHHAAFPGCSAETEASFETVAMLAAKLDELGLHTILVTESADQSIARTIKNNTQAKNQQILVMDSIQSVTLSDARQGTTYLSIMEHNLSVLKEALK